MNGKKWTERSVRENIKKGCDKEWFIEAYGMKDVDELKFQLGRFYKYNRDKCVSDLLEDMDANKNSKEGKSKDKRAKANTTGKVNTNSLKKAAFVPLANVNMTVPYNLNTHSMTSGLKIDLSKKNLQAPEHLSTEQSNALGHNDLQLKTMAELPENNELLQLRNQLNSNEEYISELQCKLDETNLKYNEDRKWFMDTVNHIKNLVAELNDARKLLPEKTASMNTWVEKIIETEQLLKLARTESENLRDKISDLTAKKVYFGEKRPEMNFDFLGGNYTIEEEKIISKITFFLTKSDIAGLIGEFSIDEIRKLAHITNVVDIIKQENKDYGLEIYFDESNDFTELVGLVTSSKVKTV